MTEHHASRSVSVSVLSGKDHPIVRTRSVWTSTITPTWWMTLTSEDAAATTTIHQPSSTIHQPPSTPPEARETAISPPPVPISTPSPSTNEGFPQGSIAAIAIGILFLTTALALLLWWWMRKRKDRKSQDLPLTRQLPSHREGIAEQHTEPLELEPHPEFNNTSEAKPWFAQRDFSDPRLSAWQGVQSPSPKPAVAEVRSFTRAWQKPRMCSVGQRPIAELPAEVAARPVTEPVETVISPVSSTHGTDHSFQVSVGSPRSGETNYRPLPFHTGDFMPKQGRM